MGSQMCRDTSNVNDLSMDPLSSEFIETEPSTISYSFSQLISKIKKLRQIIDPRDNPTLKWYQSKKYGFKLLGQIKSRRPFGQCLFYFDNELFSQPVNNILDAKSRPSYSKRKRPIILTTKISQHYTFCANTLIIYDDKSYYIGQIETKKYQIPRATGKGFLVTPEFIYEGEFQEGFPQGFGRYRTKFLEYTGHLKKGVPSGQCIQKTSKGLFMGRIDEKQKVGFLITPQNKRIQIDQKFEQSQITF